MKYLVTIEETTHTEFDVEAESIDEAVANVNTENARRVNKMIVNQACIGAEKQ